MRALFVQIVAFSPLASILTGSVAKCGMANIIIPVDTRKPAMPIVRPKLVFFGKN